MKIKIGDKAMCKVTGYTGVIIAETEWLNGCTRCGLQGPLKDDGSIPDTEWIDKPQLELVQSGVNERDGNKTGGPMPSTPKRQKGG